MQALALSHRTCRPRANDVRCAQEIGEEWMTIGSMSPLPLMVRAGEPGSVTGSPIHHADPRVPQGRENTACKAAAD